VFWFLFAFTNTFEKALLLELKLFRTSLLKKRREKSKIIAIHFRGGDHYMNAPKNTTVEEDKRLELSHIHSLIACAANATEYNSTILLVADNDVVKRIAIKYYRHSVYTSRVKPFHTDRDKSDSLVDTIGTWVDMMLLSMSDYIVLSHSGFGTLASQIGMYRKDQIISSKTCLENVNYHPMDIKARVLFRNN